jgi:hypothetical protein
MLDLISLVGFFVLGGIGWITYKIYIWPVYITPLRKIPGPSSSESLFFGNIKTLLIQEVNNNIIKSVIIILIYTFSFFLYRMHNLIGYKNTGIF